MKRFDKRQLSEAIRHAMKGGQALHVHANTGRLFDQNRKRLEREASLLGTRGVGVQREGTPKQHIVLCGRVLERAIEYAKILKIYDDWPFETEMVATLKGNEVTILIRNKKDVESMIQSWPLPPLDDES